MHLGIFVIKVVHYKASGCEDITKNKRGKGHETGAFVGCNRRK